VLVETQDRSVGTAHAARFRVTGHGGELKVHHVKPVGEHLLEGGPKRRLDVAQPFEAVRRPERGHLKQPLVRMAGTVGRIGHRDDAAAVLLRRADGLLLVFARVDERQHGHVVRPRHA
jgi:hypothetical protein